MNLKPKGGWSLDALADVTYANMLPVTITVHPAEIGNSPTTDIEKKRPASTFHVPTGTVTIDGREINGSEKISASAKDRNGIGCRLNDKKELECSIFPWKSIFLDKVDDDRVMEELQGLRTITESGKRDNGIAFPDLVSPHLNEALVFTRPWKDAKHWYAKEILDKARVSIANPLYERFTTIEIKKERGNPELYEHMNGGFDDRIITYLYMVDLSTVIQQRKQGMIRSNPMHSIIMSAPAMKLLYDPASIRQRYEESTGSSPRGLLFRTIGMPIERLLHDPSYRWRQDKVEIRKDRGTVLAMQHGQGDALNSFTSYIRDDFTSVRQTKVESWFRHGGNGQLRKQFGHDFRNEIESQRGLLRQILDRDFKQRESFINGFLKGEEPRAAIAYLDQLKK